MYLADLEPAFRTSGSQRGFVLDSWQAPQAVLNRVIISQLDASLGFFHARAGKMGDMEPNPYQSPEYPSSSPQEGQRWSFGRIATLLLCLSFALVGGILIQFWHDYSGAAYACVLLGALGAACSLFAPDDA
jgi:hypothetical protein